MNILLTSVGRRSYLVQYFKEELGDNGEVHVANSSATTPAFIAADKAVITPLIYDKQYIPFLISYCKENKIDAIITLFDVDLPILSQNKKLFSNIGVKVIVSDKSVIDICNDKVNTYNFLKNNGFNVPMTFNSVNETFNAIKLGKVKYPLIVKPRWGMGSIGVFQVDNDNELKVLYNKTLENIKKSYLKYEAKDKLDESIIIQEKLRGQEYGIDVINDLNSVYQNTIVKIKHAMRSGETDCAETVNNIQIKKLGKEISDKLGHVGNLDVDIFLVDDIPYILEMNARFGGGYPFSHIAGVNLPKSIICWIKEKEIDDYILKEQYGVLSHKDITMVQLESKDIAEKNQKKMKPIEIKQLETVSEILPLLEEFNDIFNPSISQKVNNMESYAEKIAESAFVYVAKNHKNLGFVTLYANDNVTKTAYISFIGVHPEARNKKVGRSLLELCYKKAKGQGMKYIKLEVQKKNSGAQMFYEKNGFIYSEDATKKSLYLIKEI